MTSGVTKYTLCSNHPFPYYSHASVGLAAAPVTSDQQAHPHCPHRRGALLEHPDSHEAMASAQTSSLSCPTSSQGLGYPSPGTRQRCCTHLRPELSASQRYQGRSCSKRWRSQRNKVLVALWTSAPPNGAATHGTFGPSALSFLEGGRRLVNLGAGRRSRRPSAPRCPHCGLANRKRGVHYYGLLHPQLIFLRAIARWVFSNFSHSSYPNLALNTLSI